MSDKLNESVIMPREDFIELSTVAFDNSHVPSVPERVGQTLQTTAIFAGMAGAVGLGTWLYAKAIDTLEERRAKRFAAKYRLEHGTTSE